MSLALGWLDLDPSSTCSPAPNARNIIKCLNAFIVSYICFHKLPRIYVITHQALAPESTDRASKMLLNLIRPSLAETEHHIQFPRFLHIA